MKSFAVFCFLIAVSGLSAQDAQLTPEQKAKAQQYAKECVEKTGVNIEVAAEARKGNFADDEATKNFVYCFFEHVGVVSADGQIHFEVALRELPAAIDKVEAEKVFNDCKSKTGKDAVDTFFEIFKCYYSGTKQHITFD